MTDQPRTMSKAEMTGVLRRVGMPSDKIKDLLEPLDDPIDLDEAGSYLYQHGVSMDRLIDRMGGTS